jgi:predicted glutamine amidotransferase
MCQITVSNLGDSSLNKKAFLILGSLGSTVHGDGWGFSDSEGHSWKCPLAMHWTSDAGSVIRKHVIKNNKPLLGHIRRASPQIPVSTDNSHPFKIGEIVFVHNGKLTPKKESDFVMEIEVEKMDKDGNKELNKDGSTKMEKIKRSDSLIFFEKFVEIYHTEDMSKLEQEKRFVDSLNKTMELFYGKFAMVFVISDKTYIVRGKSADLHISWRLAEHGKDSEKIGWIINTDKATLNQSTLLLSNVEQLEGRKELIFLSAEMLKAETMFVAENAGLRELGEIKENSSPVAYSKSESTGLGYSSNYYNGKKDEDFDKYKEEIFNFMMGMSLSPEDIQNILFAYHNVSILEVTKPILKQFIQEVIPSLYKRTDKDIRRDLKKVLGGFPVRMYRYSNGMAYPWFLNPISVQREFVKKLSEK